MAIDTIVCEGSVGAGATVDLPAIMNTSKTVRDGYGKARLVGIMVMGSGGGMDRAVITNSGWLDSNGIIVGGQDYVAGQGWKTDTVFLPLKTDLRPNSSFAVNVTNNSGGALRFTALLYVEYDGVPAQPPTGAGMVSRRTIAGAALVANTYTVQTAFDTLVPGVKYQLSSVRNGGLTITGICLVEFSVSEMRGLKCIMPVPMSDDAGLSQLLRMPVFPQFSKQSIAWALYSNTAETPEVVFELCASEV